MVTIFNLFSEWNWLDIAVDFDFDEWDGVTESTTYVAFKVERQWVYYFWRVYFVLAILSFLAMFPLRLEEEDRPDQLALYLAHFFRLQSDYFSEIIGEIEISKIEQIKK